MKTLNISFLIFIVTFCINITSCNRAVNNHYECFQEPHSLWRIEAKNINLYVEFYMSKYEATYLLIRNFGGRFSNIEAQNFLITDSIYSIFYEKMNATNNIEQQKELLIEFLINNIKGFAKDKRFVNAIRLDPFSYYVDYYLVESYLIFENEFKKRAVDYFDVDMYTLENRWVIKQDSLLINYFDSISNESSKP
jgi:hypothetical protein